MCGTATYRNRKLEQNWRLHSPPVKTKVWDLWAAAAATLFTGKKCRTPKNQENRRKLCCAKNNSSLGFFKMACHKYSQNRSRETPLPNKFAESNAGPNPCEQVRRSPIQHPPPPRKSPAQASPLASLSRQGNGPRPSPGNIKKRSAKTTTQLNW